MRASKRAIAGLLGMIGALGVSVSAHRLDELLQAARIAVERDQVQLELTLTPGTAVADGVLREIDSDRNGALSDDEEQAYTVRVLSAVTVRVDDSPPLRIRLAGSSFPDVAAPRTGDGAIVIRSEAGIVPLSIGPHRLFFRNTHSGANSAYIANALLPQGDEVVVTGQQRTVDQSELTIEFAVRRTLGSVRQWAWLGLASAFMLAASLKRRARVNR